METLLIKILLLIWKSPNAYAPFEWRDPFWSKWRKPSIILNVTNCTRTEFSGLDRLDVQDYPTEAISIGLKI